MPKEDATRMRKPAARAIWVLLATLAVGNALAQQLSPLSGQGTAPPGDTQVDMAVYLDRLLDIDESSFTYTAVWYVYMNWTDTRVNTSTVAAENNPTCTTFCDSSSLGGFGCCDSVWRPNLQIPNLYGLSQDRNIRFRMTIDDAGAVTWFVRIMATFYSPMAFDAFPFDSQHLTLEMQLDEPVTATGSRVGLRLGSFPARILRNSPHGRGAHVSGWGLDELQYFQFNCFSCLDDALAQFRAAKNLSEAAFNAVDAYSDTGSAQIASYALALHAPSQFWVKQDPRLVQQAHLVLCVSGQNQQTLDILSPVSWVVDLKVSRIRSYAALNYIFPILLVAWISFLVFFMDKTALEARVGIVVTLFLALTALQFTITSPASSRLSAVQQLILLTYLTLFVTGLEALLVYFVVSWHHIHRNFQAREDARGVLLQRYVEADLLEPAQAEQQLRRRKTGEGAPGHPGKPGVSGDDHLDDAKLPPPAPGVQAGLVRVPSSALGRNLSSLPVSSAEADEEIGTEPNNVAGPKKPGGSARLRVPAILTEKGRGRTRTAVGHMRDSSEYAAWVGYLLDKSVCIFLLVAYNLCAALILIINSTYYNDTLAIGKLNGTPE
ncbi:hypothetical protein WJX72_006941 [[Myrmecia] bisecta]|uniref:Neurotransmitter-gated ion-channel ligand-binding domain-containing protein n=1 Tax=[Myrmecia] bisecta TaxID=41462 RepID=A0AAW1R7M0_9CHLO